MCYVIDDLTHIDCNSSSEMTDHNVIAWAERAHLHISHDLILKPKEIIDSDLVAKTPDSDT